MRALDIMNYIEKESRAIDDIICKGQIGDETQDNALYTAFIEFREEINMLINDIFINNHLIDNAFQEETKKNEFCSQIRDEIVSFLWFGQNASTSINLLRLEYAISLERLCANVLRYTVEEHLWKYDGSFPKKKAFALLKTLANCMQKVDALENEIWPLPVWTLSFDNKDRYWYNLHGLNVMNQLECYMLECDFAKMIIEHKWILPKCMQKSIHDLALIIRTKPMYPRPYVDAENMNVDEVGLTFQEIWLHNLRNEQHESNWEDLNLEMEESKADN